jgi:L-histidine N-alpha-methyltransferase
VPVDISGDFLRDSAEALAMRVFRGCAIYPVEADFTQRVTMPDEIAGLPKLGFFPGSTIGNMVARTAVDLLRNWRCALGEGVAPPHRDRPDQGCRDARARL